MDIFRTGIHESATQSNSPDPLCVYNTFTPASLVKVL